MNNKIAPKNCSKAVPCSSANQLWLGVRPLKIQRPRSEESGHQFFRPRFFAEQRQGRLLSVELFLPLFPGPAWNANKDELP